MFPLNYKDLYEIDINPEGTESYARLAAGISGASQANNDVVDQTVYLDGDGFGSSDVTGGQKIISVTGHRVIGDSVQDYIAELSDLFGDSRKTSLKYRNALGAGFNADITIANIEVGGGDANAKKDISFELHANGKPTKVSKSVVNSLSVTVAVGTVIGTTSFTATPTGDNTLAYKLSANSAGDIYLNQYLDGVNAYTSGDDIVASSGQFLTTYELDSYGRVVNSNSHELEAGDIKAA